LSFLIFNGKGKYTEWDIKTLFLQEVFARGVLTLGTHNMSYVHSDEDISKLLKVYNEVFSVIKDVVREKSLDKRLQTKPLVPLFKIR
jgi:glutamate-1-semialdehyde 2,1-aminomutase